MCCAITKIKQWRVSVWFTELNPVKQAGFNVAIRWDGVWSSLCVLKVSGVAQSARRAFFPLARLRWSALNLDFRNKFVRTIRKMCKGSTADCTEATVCTSDPAQVWKQGWGMTVATHAMHSMKQCKYSTSLHQTNSESGQVQHVKPW